MERDGDRQAGFLDRREFLAGDPCSSASRHSAITAIRNELRNANATNWGGADLLNSILAGDDRHPRGNWGDAPSAGVDLCGARLVMPAT
jgi:hypothetical protein